MTASNSLNISQAGYVVFDGVETFSGRTFTGGTGITITNGSGVSGNTTISVSGSSVGQTITGDTGGARPPTSGNWNLFGSHGINTSGSGSTLTVAINNTVTLGDLSVIAAASPAVTATTGDIRILAGSFRLPSTTSATTGVIFQNGNRYLHSYNDQTNLFLGIGSGNFTNSTNEATGIGFQALASLSTGTQNTALGCNSLNQMATGVSNTALGDQCMLSATGDNNTAVGHFALKTSTGSQNTIVGNGAAAGAAGASADNAALGFASMSNLISGVQNSCVGSLSTQLTTGSYNTCVGYKAGFNYVSSESSNIIIGHNVLGTTAESNVIRIGASGTGTGLQNKAFIGGIDGVNVGSVAKVLTMASDQIGTATITAGTNITVTPGANTITIAATGGLTWNDTSGAFSPLKNNGYFITTTATGTLPASPAQGDTISFSVDTTNVLTIAPSGTQLIRLGSSISTVTTGTFASTARGDSITLTYRASGTTWIANASIGNWTIT